MARADAALFEAKRLGRDRVVQAQPVRRASA
jgi:PleD family two-component response regulator